MRPPSSETKYFTSQRPGPRVNASGSISGLSWRSARTTSVWSAIVIASRAVSSNPGGGRSGLSGATRGGTGSPPKGGCEAGS